MRPTSCCSWATTSTNTRAPPIRRAHSARCIRCATRGRWPTSATAMRCTAATRGPAGGQPQPWAVTWDDHEVESDYAGLSGAGAEGRLRRPAGRGLPGVLRAHAAAPAATLQAGGGFGGLQLCRRLAWGRLARLHLLDARQFPQPPGLPAGGSGSAGSVLPATCAELADPARSFLGMDRERWLDAGLAEDAAPAGDGSTPTLGVIAQQTLFSPRRPPPDGRAPTVGTAIPRRANGCSASLAGRAPPQYRVPRRGHPPELRLRGTGPRAGRPRAGQRVLRHLHQLAGGHHAGPGGRRRAAQPHVRWRAATCGWGLADVTPQRWTTVLRDGGQPAAARQRLLPPWHASWWKTAVRARYGTDVPACNKAATGRGGPIGCAALPRDHSTARREGGVPA